MKLVNSTILLLVLVSILFVSFSSISAAHVSDDGCSNVTYDDFSYSQTNVGDLNQENMNILSFNNAEVENPANDVDNSVLGQVDDSSNVDVDDSVLGQVNSLSNENNVDNSVLGQVDDSSSEDFNFDDYYDQVDVNQTSDNAFTYTVDNVSYSVYRVAIYDLESFKDAANIVSTGSGYEMILLDFKDNITLNVNPWNDVLMKLGDVKNIVVRGNGATISVCDNKRDKVHFMEVGSYYKLWMNNITMKGFNTAIVNSGVCQFRDVVFNSNKLHKKKGGAIINYGVLKCLCCNFTNNEAESGGAVYNDHGSQSMFFDCIFRGNKGKSQVWVFDYMSTFISGKSQRCLDTNDGINIYSENGVNCIVLTGNDTYYSVLINNTQDLYDVLDEISKIGPVKVLLLNLTPNVYKLSTKQKCQIECNVENLIIYGNGATFTIDASKSDEYHFMKVYAGQNFEIKDLVISGFNRAILNWGCLSLINTTFIKNKCDYMVSKDYGGAIYNEEGLLYLTQCRFNDNYAKYGAAIYNQKGIVNCDGCTFELNTAYSDGGAIYNNRGHLTCINTFFINNTSKDSGGAIYNYYGCALLLDDVFNGNVAKDDGGSIYNDFGSVSVNGSTFINSKADKGQDIYSYGEDAKCFAENSYTIYNVKDGFICQKLKISLGAPSESLRWVLRITEIGMCIALCIVCSLSGMPEVTAGIVCFIGGGLFAAGEELIEECYLDHSFNIGNILMMAVVAGFFDGITGAAGTWIGKVCFKTATQELTKIAALKLGAICFALELAGEIATEFIPRFDFSHLEVPDPLNNVTSIQPLT